MDIRRKKACLMLAAALLLSGCGSRPLSARELVRAAFFAQGERGCLVTLLLADQDAPEGEERCKTAQGSGRTPAQALQQAETELPGTAFYGLMDVVCLPAQADWQQATEIGELLYRQAKPTPELAVFLLGAPGIPDDVQAVYETLRACEKNYRLHCGLQQLFEQEELCALPVYREQGYGFALLAKGEGPVCFDDPLTAQLAAALCGLGRVLDCPYAGGDARCRAAVRVDVEPGAVQTTVRLHLAEPRIGPLSGLLPDEAAARTALRTELAAAFDALQAACDLLGADLCRLRLWTAVRYGPGTIPAAPVLRVCFE